MTPRRRRPERGPPETRPASQSPGLGLRSRQVPRRILLLDNAAWSNPYQFYFNSALTGLKTSPGFISALSFPTGTATLKRGAIRVIRTFPSEVSLGPRSSLVVGSIRLSPVLSSSHTSPSVRLPPSPRLT